MLLSFFGPQKSAKQNLPRVMSPSPVHADPAQPIEMPETSLPRPPQGCQHAIGILRKLQEKMELIPKETAPAGPEHPLAIFSEHPAECTKGASLPENDWEEILNPKMKGAFGWGHDSVEAGFARRGMNGLDGFLRFISYFVNRRGLKGSLIETKVVIIVEAIEKE